MRTISKIFQWISGVLLVIVAAFQALAMYSVLTNNSALTEKQPWLIPAWIAALVLPTAALVLFGCFSTKGRLPLLFAGMAVIGAVLALLVTLSLQNEFPVRIATSGADQGLSWWKLCYRHYSAVLAGVLVAVAALLQLPENAAAKRRRDMGGEEPHYDLTGAPLFRDGSTLGLEKFGNGEPGGALPKKEKRSVRRAREKAEQQAEKQAERRAEGSGV